jgi:hypothetical protein
MASTGHSEFPASSAYRLLACPGSFDLGKRVGPTGRRSTKYSAEGTLAHSVAESAILAGLDPDHVLGRTFTIDGFTFTPDQDFVDFVSVYSTYVQGLRALGYHVALETRVSPMAWWVGKSDLGLLLFGTADCIAYHPQLKRLAIVDLKFGYGLVEVGDNPQLLYYAAGALDPAVLQALAARFKIKGALDVDQVDTVIIQPRAPHPDGVVRRHEYTPDFVRTWAATTLYEGVEKAVNDNGKTFAAGHHCKFCPALAHCDAHDRFQSTLARDAFAALPLHNLPMTAPGVPAPLVGLPDVHISSAKLADLLDRLAILGPYKNALEQLAEDRLKAGEDVPGYKIVGRRARRAWNDDEQAILAELVRHGVDPDKLLVTELKSPAQVEKSVGAKLYRDVVKGHVMQQSSGVNLVPDNDPRARLAGGRTALEAFGFTKPANDTDKKEDAA